MLHPLSSCCGGPGCGCLFSLRGTAMAGFRDWLRSIWAGIRRMFFNRQTAGATTDNEQATKEKTEMPLLDDLESLRTQADAAFKAAADKAALETARVEYLGTRGKLKAMLGRMGEIPKEQKPVVGKRANEI